VRVHQERLIVGFENTYADAVESPTDFDTEFTKLGESVIIADTAVHPT